MRYKGAIFDMDGLMLDTERLYVKYWFKAAPEFSVKLKMEDILACRGLTGEFALNHFKNCYGEDFPYQAIRNRRNEMFYEHIETIGIDKKAGLVDLLEYLKNKGYRLAVATSNLPDDAEKFLRIAGVYDYFDELVYGTMVKRSKPEPDIFLLASEMLGLEPKDCVVFEDSPNGIRAASAAGCAPIMIPDLDQPTDDIIPLLLDQKSSLFEAIELLESFESQ